VKNFKPKPSDQDRNEEKKCIIQVVDIPLFVKRPQIELAFARYGKILKINTKAKGLYQQAYITFQHVYMIKSFYNQWSVNIGNDAVRVLPINLFKENCNLRNLYCLKLSEFPYHFPIAVLMKL